VWIIEGDPFWCPLAHGDDIPADEQATPGFLEQVTHQQPYWSVQYESASRAALTRQLQAPHHHALMRNVVTESASVAFGGAAASCSSRASIASLFSNGGR
jgi:hypothetical protein